jgi:hypothetical protein
MQNKCILLCSCVVILTVCFSNEGSAQTFPIIEWVQSFFGEDEGPPYTVLKEISPVSNCYKRCW